MWARRYGGTIAWGNRLMVIRLGVGRDIEGHDGPVSITGIEASSRRV